MNLYTNQKGVGMIEVLVALLLLAIGVLGYVALQLRALDASAEALSKSQAMLIMRGLAEDIRANPSVVSSYPTLVQSYSNFSTSTAGPKSCLNAVCTPTEMATFDAFQTAQKADQYGMKLTMENCPGVTNSMASKRQCLYSFWGKTLPTRTTSTASDGTQSTAIRATSCMSNAGVYVDGASCLMMEVY